MALRMTCASIAIDHCRLVDPRREQLVVGRPVAPSGGEKLGEGTMKQTRI
jgi:hypothetical protein